MVIRSSLRSKRRREWEKESTSAGSWIPMELIDPTINLNSEGSLHDPGDVLLLLFFLGLKGAPSPPSPFLSQTKKENYPLCLLRHMFCIRSRSWLILTIVLHRSAAFSVWFWLYCFVLLIIGCLDGYSSLFWKCFWFHHIHIVPCVCVLVSWNCRLKCLDESWEIWLHSKVHIFEEWAWMVTFWESLMADYVCDGGLYSLFILVCSKIMEEIRSRKIRVIIWCWIFSV